MGVCAFVIVLLIQAQLGKAQSEGIEWLGAQLRYSQKSAGSDVSADGVILTIHLDIFATQASSAKTQQVRIFESMTGTLVKTMDLSLNKVSEPNSSSCADGQGSSSIQRFYSGQLPLGIMAGGYTIQWTTCCLEPMVTNAEIMPGTGILLTATVPDPMEMVNSSSNVTFTNHPSVCSGQSNQIVLEAKDADGDQLKTTISKIVMFQDNGTNEGDELLATNQFVPLRAECSLKKPFGDGEVKIDDAGNLEINNVGPGNYLLGLETTESRKQQKISTTQWVVVVTIK